MWKNYKNERYWNEYKQKRNDYNIYVKQNRNNHSKIKFIIAKNNKKNMWKCINELVRKDNIAIPREIIFEDETTTEAREISNKFNKYLIKSIMDITQNIQIVPESRQERRSEMNINTFKFKEINIETLNKIAGELKNKVNKNELFNIMVLGDSLEYTGFFLVNIINESLNTGIVPDKWKLSTITPIQKVKNKKKAEEYRPINTLPPDEKIIEKIVKNQLVSHITENNILIKEQSGFREHHSCKQQSIM